MPIAQIAESASNIAKNTSIIHSIQDWAGVLYPILGVIGAVFIWAWNRMQRSVDRMEDALVEHADNNEKLFNEVFSAQRASDKILNTLAGEHNAMHSRNFSKDGGSDGK